MEILGLFAIGMLVCIILLCIEMIFVNKQCVYLDDLPDIIFVSIFWIVVIPWVLRDILFIPAINKMKRKS